MSSGGDGLNDRGCEYGMYGGQHCAVALRVQQRGVPPQRDPGPAALAALGAGVGELGVRKSKHKKR